MTRFDTSTYTGKRDAINAFNNLLNEKAIVEVKKVKKTRSVRQNAALHLYYTFISDQLNEMGAEFTYKGIRGYELSTRYTPLIIKEHFWKPIQMHLFKKESTTEITTSEMNEIIEIINRFFAEKGVDIEFPSYESLVEHSK